MCLLFFFFFVFIWLYRFRQTSSLYVNNINSQFIWFHNIMLLNCNFISTRLWFCKYSGVKINFVLSLELTLFILNLFQQLILIFSNTIYRGISSIQIMIIHIYKTKNLANIKLAENPQTKNKYQSKTKPILTVLASVKLMS